jgi:hypothetical protein
MTDQSSLAPEEIVEIKGQDVTLRRGPTGVSQTKLSEFIARLYRQQDISIFPDESPLPDHVRFVRRRGNATTVVIELQPQVRQVRWIASNSPEDYGPGTRYDYLTLAFPYIVVIILFKEGELSGYQQLFYRTEGISSVDDHLLFPNLLNVAEGYNQKCWLCLANLGPVGRLSWRRKVEKIIEHTWEAAWNRSSEVHEGNSYWQKMRKANLDPRVISVENWVKATKEDPLFMLKIQWKSADLTIKQVMDSMLSAGYASFPIQSTVDLIPLICGGRSPSNRPLSSKNTETLLKQIQKMDAESHSGNVSHESVMKKIYQYLRL